MAGLVLKGRFPRRRLIQIVAANIIRYVFRGAARNWVRNFGSTAPALGSMSLLLLMSGLVGLVGFALYNLEQVEAGQASMLHVYMRDDVAGADVNALWDRLASDPRVASVKYVTKAEALHRAQRIPGLPQLAYASDSNPFPASLDVQVKNIDDVAAIDAMARADIAVDPVYPTSYDRGAYQRIQAVLFGMAVAGSAFLALLGFVAVTVTVNHPVCARRHGHRCGDCRSDRVRRRPGAGLRLVADQPAEAPGIVRGCLIALSIALLVLAADGAAATANTTAADPRQQLALIEQIRAQLGSNLADALAAQQQLQKSLQENAAQQQVVRGNIADSEAKIAELDAQIQEAMRHEAALVQRIETERTQLRQLARAIYVEPSSVLVLLGQSQSLSDLLTRIADLGVAGNRASDLKS